LIAASSETDSGADEIICKSPPSQTESAEMPFDAPGIVLVSDRPTVVNVSRLESNPDRLDPDAIAHDLGSDQEASFETQSVIPGENLTPPFATAVLVFLLLELILANARSKQSQSKRSHA
jgi:hypothetical protein